MTNVNQTKGVSPLFKKLVNGNGQVPMKVNGGFVNGQMKKLTVNPTTGEYTEQVDDRMVTTTNGRRERLSDCVPVIMSGRFMGWTLL